MRKFLFIVFLFFFSLPSFGMNEATFIYINGSNTNTEKSKEEFINGVNGLHKQIISHFNKDEFVRNKIFNEYSINPIAKTFYWGDLSKNEIELIQEDFDFMKLVSPKPANYVRNFIAMCLHDAIWISKMENMYPVVNKLHRRVIKEHLNGNKVVLVGYSAGTFITHQYLFLKMPVIKAHELVAKSKIDNKFKDYILSKPFKDTCTDAVFRSKLVTYDVENSFVLEDDFESFKRKVDFLDDYTERYCAPKEVLLGSINYASPFALFYSDIYKMSDVMGLSYKFIVENGLFWLTVNYSDDPLGFPVSKNITIDEVEKHTNLAIEPNGGFIYDKSDKSSTRTFLMAHLAYFKTAKRYAKILTEAMKQGYAYFYMTNQD